MRTDVILSLVLMLTLCTARAESELTQSHLANAVLAIVNSEVITIKDVERAIAPAVNLLSRQYKDQPAILNEKVDALQRERVEELIANQLILSDFTNSGFNLPESYIEDRVQDRIRKDYYGDRAKLTKTLREEGVTYEQFRRNIRENIIIGALQEKHISQELIISPHKIEAYYQTNTAQFQLEDQVKLRMIVLNKAPDALEATRKLAEEILGKLGAGASFAEMASVYSEGSQRSEGGDWGWVERKVLKKELAETAFSLKPGQRSGVLDTTNACYLMLVEDTRPAHTKPLSEVRDEIEKKLLALEQNRLLRRWIDRLKAKAFVRYF